MLNLIHPAAPNLAQQSPISQSCTGDFPLDLFSPLDLLQVNSLWLISTCCPPSPPPCLTSLESRSHRSKIKESASELLILWHKICEVLYEWEAEA